MKMAFKEYASVVFDCDGVILNSNHLKIQAYYNTAIQFGASSTQAQALVEHHIALGGISRYPKFEYFICHIMQQPFTEASMHKLLTDFNAEVEAALMQCEVSSALPALRANSAAGWMVLSGGDQAEIRHVFAQRGLAHYFNLGIFGSPDNKDQVLAREIASGQLRLPALFIGDSQYDHQASQRAGLDFVFLSDWTDLPDWQAYTGAHQITVRPHLQDLL